MRLARLSQPKRFNLLYLAYLLAYFALHALCALLGLLSLGRLRLACSHAELALLD